MKRAALYVRVSTDHQAEEGYSVDEQEERLRAYCAAQDWTVAGIYRDPGYSGSSLERPGIRRLMEEASHYDIIAVHRLDRLSRSQQDTLHLIEDVFTPAGASFVSITESFDTSTSVGKMMVGILSAFSQLERERIKERMQMGLVGRAKAGRPMRWSNPAIGYTYADGKYMVDEAESDVVREVYRLYLAGETQKGIVSILTKRNALGKKWYSAIIKRILTNPVYIGVNRYQGEEYEGDHDPIVSEDDFERVQSELKRRQDAAYAKGGNRPFQSHFMLSGLLRCGLCGHTLILNAYKPRKDGTRKRVYRCASAMAQSSVGEVRRAEHCEAPSYELGMLEARVLAEVERLRADPGRYPKQTTGPSRREGQIAKRLAAIGKSEARLVDLYVDGGMPLPALEKKRDALAAERASLEAERSAIASKQPQMAEGELRSVLGAIPSTVTELPYAEQRTLVRTLIDGITVDADSITISWRFE